MLPVESTWSSTIDDDAHEDARMSAEYTARRPIRRVRTHPGLMVREDLEALGVSVAQAARELGVSRQSLHSLLGGRSSVSPEMAARLGKYLGNGPGFWLRVQANFDEAEALGTIDVSKIPTRRVA